MNIGIVGIHTGIGKTVCSTVICQALGYDYWKPVQAGDLENTDSLFIKNNVSNPSCAVHPERYKLLTAASPHYAASLESIDIQKQHFVLPVTKNNLVVETAGGLMSPLSTSLLNVDLIEYLKLPIILVSNNYLGSINHTLLTYSIIKDRKIPVIGLVFVGEATPSTEKFILEYTRLPLLFSIPWFKTLSPKILQAFAQSISIKLS